MTTTQHTQRSADRADRRARRFARLWRAMDASVDEQIRPAKTDLLTGLEPDGAIVEIGPGRGSNFPYYSSGSRIIAYEPNRHFADDLRAAAREHGHDLDLRIADLFAEPLPDASVDLVVSTLVLCSVGDPGPVLEGVRRILRPGGRLVFIEHVAEPAGSLRALYQRIVRRPWRAIGDGCDPRNSTLDALRRSAFEITEDRLERFGSGLDPTNLVYSGVARKVARG